MLIYVERHPGIAVDRILAKSPGRMRSFLPQAANDRSNVGRPRVGLDAVTAERERLDAAIAGEMDVRTAALAMLADALRLIVLPDPDRVLVDCGEANWIVKACVDYLLLLRVRYELSVFAAGAGSG